MTCHRTRIALHVAGACALAITAGTPPVAAQDPGPRPPGEAPSIAGQEALQTALSRERALQDAYRTMLAELGLVLPFSWLQSAKEVNEVVIVTLFAHHGMAVPAREAPPPGFDVPGSLEECCAMAFAMEAATARKYRDLIPVTPDAGIRNALADMVERAELTFLPELRRCIESERVQDNKERDRPP